MLVSPGMRGEYPSRLLRTTFIVYGHWRPCFRCPLFGGTPLWVGGPGATTSHASTKQQTLSFGCTWQSLLFIFLKIVFWSALNQCRRLAKSVENGKFTCAVLVATTMDGWEQAITLRVRQRHDQLLQFATQLLTLVGKERSDEKLLLEALQKLKEVRRSAERFAKASETLERQEQHLVATVLPSLERTVKHLRERFVSEQAEMTLMDAQKADEQELHALCAQAEQLPSCTVLEQQLVERQETLEAASRQSLHQRQRLKDLQDTLENLRHHIAVLGGILGAGS
jgi:hypothetical protein